MTECSYGQFSLLRRVIGPEHKKLCPTTRNVSPKTLGESTEHFSTCCFSAVSNSPQRGGSAFAQRRLDVSTSHPDPSGTKRCKKRSLHQRVSMHPTTRKNMPRTQHRKNKRIPLIKEIHLGSLALPQCRYHCIARGWRNARQTCSLGASKRSTVAGNQSLSLRKTGQKGDSQRSRVPCFAGANACRSPARWCKVF